VLQANITYGDLHYRYTVWGIALDRKTYQLPDTVTKIYPKAS